MKTKGIETCTMYTHALVDADTRTTKRFRNIQKYHTPAKHVTEYLNEEKYVIKK